MDYDKKIEEMEAQAKKIELAYLQTTAVVQWLKKEKQQKDENKDKKDK